MLIPNFNKSVTDNRIVWVKIHLLAGTFQRCQTYCLTWILLEELYKRQIISVKYLAYSTSKKQGLYKFRPIGALFARYSVQVFCILLGNGDWKKMLEPKYCQNWI